MIISVVVPAFNEAKWIASCIRSIRQASTAFQELGWQSECIVCNNNSTDQTASLAEAEGATVVFEPVHQIARARNRGAAAASGDWLIFVDADSQPSAGLFRDVATAIQSGKVLAGGSIIQLDQSSWESTLVARGWNLLSRTAGWLAGSFIFCETNAFLEIGGFSQELFVAEELDLTWRLKRLARRRRKKLVILHRHPLATSSRKMHLYTRREHLRFLLRAMFQPGRTLKDRAACGPWYDGRR